MRSLGEHFGYPAKTCDETLLAASRPLMDIEVLRQQNSCQRRHSHRSYAISFTASPYELERLGLRCCLATLCKHPQDGIQHGIQFLAYVLGKKAQHEVAVLLQQLVLPPIATIRDRIREVLSAIEFDGHARVGA
jgi:hypothetical protein